MGKNQRKWTRKSTNFPILGKYLKGEMLSCPVSLFYGKILFMPLGREGGGFRPEYLPLQSGRHNKSDFIEQRRNARFHARNSRQITAKSQKIRHNKNCAFKGSIFQQSRIHICLEKMTSREFVPLLRLLSISDIRSMAPT